MKTALNRSDEAKQKFPNENRMFFGSGSAFSLCTNCGEADICLLRIVGREPVLYCEEYRCVTCPTPTGGKGGVEGSGRTCFVPSDSVQGLCVNCDHRETCRLPKNEAGVWYCEEYE